MEAATSTRAVSECFIKPKLVVDEAANEPFHLGATDLMQMAQLYLQIGLMFERLPSKEEGGMDVFLERLKQSLSSTLAHFYPLAGKIINHFSESSCVNCQLLWNWTSKNKQVNRTKQSFRTPQDAIH